MSEKLILLPRLVRFNLGLEWGTNVHVDHRIILPYASTILGLYVNVLFCMLDNYQVAFNCNYKSKLARNQEFAVWLGSLGFLQA